MDDIISSPPSPNFKKRPLIEDNTPRKKALNTKGTQFIMPTPPDTDQSSNVSPDDTINNDTDDRERAVSPAPSSSALSSTIEIMSTNTALGPAPPAGSSNAPSSTNGLPPAKRRKLTPSEKLEKQQAKEAREKEKAENKARKDEERRVKDEEKAKRDDEKREEKRIKDEEKRRKAEDKEVKKREKELDEERKVQEKMSKERKQMRLGAFFQQKPMTPPRQSGIDEFQAQPRRRSLSLETYDNVADQIRGSPLPMKGTPPPPSAKKLATMTSEISDYQKEFLPFALQNHTFMAERFTTFSEAAQDAFDRELPNPSLQQQYDLGMISSYQGHPELDNYFETDRKLTRGAIFPAMRNIIDAIHGTSVKPIDLTGDSPSSAMDILRLAPIKHIQFHEDVRPAYCGTYTKLKSQSIVSKLRRNPFTRARQDTNYDYDSEVEWEPPEEGDEDVLSDEEDEIDSQADANDMDFLDDEDDSAKSKRKIITGELVPESTGLCWANQHGCISVVQSIEVNNQPREMCGMTMGILLPEFSGSSIDPFSTAYWEQSVAATSTSVANSGLTAFEKITGSMAPPRAPLQPRLNNNSSPPGLIGAAEGQKGPITSTHASTPSAKRGPKPAPKTLSKEDLEEFKEAVVKSPLGKLELLRGLKARFPKMTNEVIKETLSSQFAQLGKGKADKHWVFVGLT